MRSFDIFVTLCGAVIASYAAMGFPRKMVLLCSIPPLSLLFFGQFVFNLTPKSVRMAIAWGTCLFGNSMDVQREA